MALQVEQQPSSGSFWQRMVAYYGAMHSSYYLIWLGMNTALLFLLLGVRSHFLQPVARIIQHLQLVRAAFAQDGAKTNPEHLTMRHIASDIGRFATMAMEYYRKHQEVSLELEQARHVIAQFSLQQ